MILRGSQTVLVQGITGKQGTLWGKRMRDYGTRIVGGVGPNCAGERHLDLPVWAMARKAARETSIDAAVMFIPRFGVAQTPQKQACCLSNVISASNHSCARGEALRRAGVL